MPGSSSSCLTALCENFFVVGICPFRDGVLRGADPLVEMCMCGCVESSNLGIFLRLSKRIQRV